MCVGVCGRPGIVCGSVCGRHRVVWLYLGQQNDDEVAVLVLQTLHDVQQNLEPRLEDKQNGETRVRQETSSQYTVHSQGFPQKMC